MIDRILHFLISRGWSVANQSQSFYELQSPAVFNLPQDFRLHIPTTENKSDSKRFFDNILEIISDFYGLTIEDLDVILKSENTVFKVRVYDQQTEDGKMPLGRFEEMIERIKCILTDTASFVIDKSVMSTRVPDEVTRYLRLCNFMQTERGSFVAKIQLPSKELIKEGELFDRDEVYSVEINNKLGEVLNFVKENIFEGEIEDVNEEYLIENESRLNVKLLKDIGSFFDKADLKNIDFTFHEINSSTVIVNQNVTKQKLHKLTEFVEKIESHSFDSGQFVFRGTIIAMKSKDPEGLRNGITFSGINNDLAMVATANLSSEQYKIAADAHIMKQYITVTGLAKWTKTRVRFVEITDFTVEE